MGWKEGGDRVVRSWTWGGRRVGQGGERWGQGGERLGTWWT